MFATVVNSKTETQSQNLTANTTAETTAQQSCEWVEESEDSWETYYSSLRAAVESAIAARTTAQRDYERVQTEADTWERWVQRAIAGGDNNLVRQSLSRKTVCQERVRSLKAVVDKYSVQISTLSCQLAFWNRHNSY